MRLPTREEERRLEPRLDVAKLVAERGLGQVEARGRLRHAAGFCDAGDELKMPDIEVHGSLLERPFHEDSSFKMRRP